MGVNEFIDIKRSQKILRGVAGIKSILWILVILRGCMVSWGLQYGFIFTEDAWTALPSGAAIFCLTTLFGRKIALLRCCKVIVAYIQKKAMIMTMKNIYLTINQQIAIYSIKFFLL